MPEASHFWRAEPDVERALDESRRALSALGAMVKVVRMPDLHRYYHPANVINKVEGAAAHARWIRERRKDYSASALSRLEMGFQVPATQYLDALRARPGFLREFVATALADVDIVHLPTVAMTAPGIEETRFRDSASQPELVERITRLTRWVNYLGLPALTCPCGRDGAGLPIGFQLVGRPYSESTLLRLGAAFQKITTWHDAAPAASRV
jgi:aspartyl-tRNA(Asn)/glutamyl-tRNA(Gln) amidotransferase subunit A